MGRREDNKAKKLAALEEAASHLFLEQGYHRTSIEQIVSEAGIARGTYYLYFADKTAIFKHLLNKLITPVTQCLERTRSALEVATSREDTQAVYMDLASSIGSALLTNQTAGLLYYREQRDPGEIGDWLRDSQRNFDNLVTALVASLMERKMLRRADPKVVAMAIIGAIDKIAYAYLMGDNFDDQEMVGMTVIALFGEGLVIPASQLEHLE